MLRLIRFLLRHIDGTVNRHSKFIYTTLAYILAAGFFIAAIYFAKQFSNQLNFK